MADEKRYFQFDGSNFSNWKYRIQTILEEKDLLDYIEEDIETIIDELDEVNDEAVISNHTKNEKKMQINPCKAYWGQLPRIHQG